MQIPEPGTPAADQSWDSTFCKRKESPRAARPLLRPRIVDARGEEKARERNDASPSARSRRRGDDDPENTAFDEDSSEECPPPRYDTPEPQAETYRGYRTLRGDRAHRSDSSGTRGPDPEGGSTSTTSSILEASACLEVPGGRLPHLEAPCLPWSHSKVPEDHRSHPNISKTWLSRAKRARFPRKEVRGALPPRNELTSSYFLREQQSSACFLWPLTEDPFFTRSKRGARLEEFGKHKFKVKRSRGYEKDNDDDDDDENHNGEEEKEEENDDDQDDEEDEEEEDIVRILDDNTARSGAIERRLPKRRRKRRRSRSRRRGRRRKSQQSGGRGKFEGEKSVGSETLGRRARGLLLVFYLLAVAMFRPAEASVALSAGEKSAGLSRNSSPQRGKEATEWSHPYNEYTWEVNQINPWLSACDLAGPAPADLQGSCGPPEVPKNCPGACRPPRGGSQEVPFAEVIERLGLGGRAKSGAAGSRWKPGASSTSSTGNKDRERVKSQQGVAAESRPEQCLFYLEPSHKKDICRDNFARDSTFSFSNPRENRFWFLSGLRLRHCCEHAAVNALAPGKDGPLEAVLNGGDKCTEALDKLLAVDKLAARLHCEFEEVLARYDCAQSYSVIHNCTHCKEAYRKWVCSSLVPYFAHGGPPASETSVNAWSGTRLRPCGSFCQSVEQRCPYLLPGDRAPAYPTQYAGEPTFLCRDPNIPETGEQAMRSLHSNTEDECCFHVCSEDEPGSGVCANCTDRQAQSNRAGHDIPTAPQCEITTTSSIQSGSTGENNEDWRVDGSDSSAESSSPSPSASTTTTSASFCGGGGVGSMVSSSSGKSASGEPPPISISLICLFWIWAALVKLSNGQTLLPSSSPSSSSSSTIIGGRSPISGRRKTTIEKKDEPISSAGCSPSHSRLSSPESQTHSGSFSMSQGHSRSVASSLGDLLRVSRSINHFRERNPGLIVNCLIAIQRLVVRAGPSLGSTHLCVASCCWLSRSGSCFLLNLGPILARVLSISINTATAIATVVTAINCCAFLVIPSINMIIIVMIIMMIITVTMMTLTRVSLTISRTFVITVIMITMMMMIMIVITVGMIAAVTIITIMNILTFHFQRARLFSLFEAARNFQSHSQFFFLPEFARSPNDIRSLGHFS